MNQKINLLGIRKKAILCHFEDFKHRQDVCVLETIDENKELEIDKTKKYKNNEGITIDANSIYFYGDIDINNEKDIELIYHKNLIDDNAIIRSDFNYEKGIHYVSDVVRESPISDPLKWFKYNYCLIGKPNKVIVYKISRKLL